MVRYICERLIAIPLYLFLYIIHFIFVFLELIVRFFAEIIVFCMDAVYLLIVWVDKTFSSLPPIPARNFNEGVKYWRKYIKHNIELNNLEYVNHDRDLLVKLCVGKSTSNVAFKYLRANRYIFNSITTKAKWKDEDE